MSWRTNKIDQEQREVGQAFSGEESTGSKASEEAAKWAKCMTLVDTFEPQIDWQAEVDELNVLLDGLGYVGISSRW